ncbi:GTP-binding protein 10 homolog [Leptopilina heterotoma]|uniref:GTP-binding protein 10 homolog n=1 Tax=Leptopilina heterotoma TaxID=63436 RepID=UPI001CA9523E|nr:GTP-binding protein 10 homolog [Leptopilina heterotoma]
MVFTSRILFFATKLPKEEKPMRKFLRTGFLDNLRIHVKAGHGGSGLPKYGGKGGRGGNVFIQASKYYTLKATDRLIRARKLEAKPGMNSTARGLIGTVGDDLIIKVPTGVVAHDENGIVIGEVNEPMSRLKIADGGVGGCKETNYCGKRGQARTIILDLKLISDIAVVGFPNAGKSTLLKAISRASPKVAEYPFTTVRPNIGIMGFKDLRKITVGDLPGLIEGAHQNVGMGYKFLKHIERSKMILFVVDIQGFQLSPKHVYRNFLETIVLLNKEIELYNPDLIDMPAMLLINKMDTPGAEDTLKSLYSKVENLKNHLDEFPEEIRPDNIVKFLDIYKVSMQNMRHDEKELLKYRIRNALDKCTSEEEFENMGAEPVFKLIEQMKKNSEKVTPLLV